MFTTIVITLHVLAAVTVLGGMVYLVLAIHPGLAQEPDPDRRATLEAAITGRIRPLLLGAMAVSLLTGLHLVFGVALRVPQDAGGTLGMYLGAKLLLALTLLGLAIKVLKDPGNGFWGKVTLGLGALVVFLGISLR